MMQNKLAQLLKDAGWFHRSTDRLENGSEVYEFDNGKHKCVSVYADMIFLSGQGFNGTVISLYFEHISYCYQNKGTLHICMDKAGCLSFDR